MCSNKTLFIKISNGLDLALGPWFADSCPRVCSSLPWGPVSSRAKSPHWLLLGGLCFEIAIRFELFLKLSWAHQRLPDLCSWVSQGPWRQDSVSEPKTRATQKSSLVWPHNPLSLMNGDQRRRQLIVLKWDASWTHFGMNQSKTICLPAIGCVTLGKITAPLWVSVSSL